MIRAAHTCCLCSCLVLSVVAGSAVSAAAQTTRPAPAAPVAGFGDIARGALNDFRNLPQQESAKWLTVGLAAAMLAQSIDTPSSAALSASPAANRIFGPGETLGGARVQLASALATYGIGRATGHARTAAFGADLVRANILAQALTSGIKLSVRRGRPDGTQYSFPSGHASVSFAAATVVQRHFGWKAGVPAYAGATYVAASRIQAKRHFLSDVAFGAVVGLVSGRTVTIGHGRHRFAIEPLAAPAGVGIQLSRR